MSIFSARNPASLPCPEGYRIERFKNGVACLRNDVTAEQLNFLLSHPGQVLKENVKCQVVIVGNWLVKKSRSGVMRGFFRHAFGRGRHRRAWIAAHHLRQNGVSVPEPLAYYESTVFGMVAGSVHVHQYLSGFSDVEHFAAELIASPVAAVKLPLYLANLAHAVNTMETANAHHADLSGKNIFTKDGVRFFFIDLDAVETGVPCDPERRMKNHVQLYDSFCDAMSDALLVPFIRSMLPPDTDIRLWMPEVRKRQAARRLKVEAYWAKHGAPKTTNPLRNV